MKTLLINNHTKLLDELVAILPGEVTVIDKNDFALTATEPFDFIVLSGGSNVPTVLHHPEEYLLETELLLTTTKPVLGICLGAEIVGTTFGGELASVEKHEGPLTISITDSSLADAVGSKELISYECHSVGMKKTPADLITCATSPHSIEIFKHKTKPIVGIQFHPEITAPKGLWDWIFAQEAL